MQILLKKDLWEPDEYCGWFQWVTMDMKEIKDVDFMDEIILEPHFEYCFWWDSLDGYYEQQWMFKSKEKPVEDVEVKIIIKKAIEKVDEYGYTYYEWED